MEEECSRSAEFDEEEYSKVIAGRVDCLLGKLIEIGFEKAGYFDRKHDYQIKSKKAKVEIIGIAPNVSSGRFGLSFGYLVRTKSGRDTTSTKSFKSGEEDSLVTYLKGFLH